MNDTFSWFCLTGVKNNIGPVALTPTGFQIILYDRYDSYNYASFGLVRFVAVCLAICH